MTDTLKAKLEEVRALLGPKAVSMGFAELFAEMADLSAQKLTEKKFGNKRAGTTTPASGSASTTDSAPTQSADSAITPTTASKNARYIPKAIQQTIWRRDKHKCTNCGGKRNLNIDHIQPVACGGKNAVDNLRLLCFTCNQRAAIKVFGVTHMVEKWLEPH